MKILRNISLLGATVALSSCGIIENMNQPISDDGFNPLDKAGSRSYKKNADGLLSVGSSSNPSIGVSHGFKSGDVVDVAIANTALYKRVPKAGDKYKRVLKVGESLKVISTSKEFLKVSTPAGDTGYVSSVMVISQGASSGGPAVPAPVGDIAPPPEIPSIEAPTIAPVEPIPVPSITEPVEVDPVEVPSLPDPVVPDFPDPAPVVPDIPDPAPAVPGIQSLEPLIPSIPDEPAPEPELPGLPF